MNTIHLHGRLGDTFGGPYRLEVRDAAEAVRLLGTQLSGFLEMVREGTWKVVRGKPGEGLELDEEGLAIGLGEQPLHIIPVAHGAGGGGGKAILGVAMIGAAFLTGGLSIAASGALSATAMGVAAGSMGMGLIIAGASMMMAPTPETGDYENKQKNEQSFLFNGPVNVNKQGVAVPLIYGEVITGSVVISAGIRAEDIPVGGAPDTLPGEILAMMGKWGD